MKSQSITITARTLHALIDPVLPCASSDIGLPVLNGVLIESRGKWLTATATDRFRLGVKRIGSPDGEAWPEFRAVVSTRSLRNIFATFKPQRGLDPELDLAIEGDRLSVKASGGLDDMAGASASYWLVDGEYPKADRLLRKALDAEPQPIEQAFNWQHLSAFKAADKIGVGLRVKAGGGPTDPLLVVGDDFLGILMPRKISGDLADQGWGDVLTNTAEKKVEAVA